MYIKFDIGEEVLDLISSATGKHVCTASRNFVRDNVCGGNEKTYNVVKSVTALGSIAVSGFQVVRSLKGLLEARQAAKVADAGKALEAMGEAKINPYEILDEHGIPTTLTSEQREACDAEELAMKVKPNADAVNKAPYDPRKMESLLKEGNAEISSSTLPRFNQPNVRLANKIIERTVEINAETGETVVQRIAFDQRGFPIFDSYVKYETRISGDLHLMDRATHMRAATRQLRADIESGIIDKSLFTDKELAHIRSGLEKIGNYTWHHHQDTGRMQLVPTSIHKWVKHTGGFDLWGKK